MQRVGHSSGTRRRRSRAGRVRSSSNLRYWPASQSVIALSHPLVFGRQGAAEGTANAEARSCRTVKSLAGGGAGCRKSQEHLQTLSKSSPSFPAGGTLFSP